MMTWVKPRWGTSEDLGPKGEHKVLEKQTMSSMDGVPVLCLFCYFLMLRRRLSSNFVAERRATTPLTYLGSYGLVRLIFAAVE